MKLIPDYISAGSNGSERRLFEILRRSEGLKGWFGLHSFNLIRHASKREGEIDFLIVGPAGLFVLEVKGGQLKRKNGAWLVKDRFKRQYRKQESPFDQAKSGLYSLTSDLVKNLGFRADRHVFGYGVVFTAMEFKVGSPEWDRAIICDKLDLQQPIESYVERLATHWRARGRGKQDLSRRQVEELVAYLRGDFEAVLTLSDQVAESEVELAELTTEQIRTFDIASSNPRILLSGAAGTGKTMIAVEMLKRNVAQGQSVLLLCYNKLLAGYLKFLLAKQAVAGRYEVDTLHNFIRRHIHVPNEQIDAAEDKTALFKKEFPDKFLSAVATQDIRQFDYLIVDEAQDILSSRYLAVFDKIVNGGLDNGRWLVCLDNKSQNIYSTAGEIKPALESLRSKAAQLELTVNCRNTPNIAQAVELVAGIDIAEVKEKSGATVKYMWYKDVEDQLRQVSALIKRFLKEGFSAGDITILSPRAAENSLAESRLRADFSMHRLIPADFIGAGRQDSIGYSTIHAYKGLENKAVVLTDIESINEGRKLLNYVGLTRARALLAIAVKRDQKRSFTKRLRTLLPKFGRNSGGAGKVSAK